MLFADGQRVRRGNFYGGCTYSVTTCCRVFPHGGYRPRTAAMQIQTRFFGESARGFSRASDRITALTHGHTYEVLSFRLLHTARLLPAKQRREFERLADFEEKKRPFLF